MTTLVKVFADLIEQANAAPREIAEGAARELIDAARGAGFLIHPEEPHPASRAGREIEILRAVRKVVYSNIETERVQQDQQWGGPEHDDQHQLEDWCMFIEYQLERCNGVGGPEYRERMVKVAALAVAAIESWDRVYKDAPQPSTQMTADQQWTEEEILEMRAQEAEPYTINRITGE